MKKAYHVNAVEAMAEAAQAVDVPVEATSVLKKAGAATEAAAEVETEEVVAVGTDVVAVPVINRAKVEVAQATIHVKVDLKDVAAEVQAINHVKVVATDATVAVLTTNPENAAAADLREKAAAIINQGKGVAVAQTINHVKEKAEVHLREKLAVAATIEAMLLKNVALKINHIPHQADLLKDLTEAKEEKLNLEVVMLRKGIANKKSIGWKCLSPLLP